MENYVCKELPEILAESCTPLKLHQNSVNKADDEANNEMLIITQTKVSAYLPYRDKNMQGDKLPKSAGHNFIHIFPSVSESV